MGNVKIDPERVKEILTARGYTQKSFCESCERLVPQTRKNMRGNMSPNYFNRRLNNLKSFESDMLDFICKQLDVIPDYLTGASSIALPYRFSFIESDIDSEDDLAAAVLRRYTYGRCDVDSMKQKDLETYELLLWSITGYFLENKGYMDFYGDEIGYTDGRLLDNIREAMNPKPKKSVSKSVSDKMKKDAKDYLKNPEARAMLIEAGKRITRAIDNLV